MTGNCPFGIINLLKEDGLVAFGGHAWQLWEIALKKLVLSQEKQDFFDESKRLLGERHCMQPVSLKNGAVKGHGMS